MRIFSSTFLFSLTASQLWNPLVLAFTCLSAPRLRTPLPKASNLEENWQGHGSFSTRTTTAATATTTELSMALGRTVASNTFVGHVWPILSKFLIGPKMARHVIAEVFQATIWQDVLILVFLAYALPYLPVFRFLLGRLRGQSGDNLESGDDASSPEEEDLSLWGVVIETDAVGRTVRSFARVSLLAYLVEVFCIASKALGFKSKLLLTIPVNFAKLAYSFWGVRGFLRAKRVLLCRFYKVKAKNMGRVEILDRLSSGISVAIAFLFAADWLSVKMGLALKGLLTFGSVGTLAFTFASKDLASQLVSGLALSLSNKVAVGDSVEFTGNGPSTNDAKGKVIKLGWMETVIRESDSRLTIIPNSLLGGKKISNLSRVKISQVSQKLRFHYDEADKMPALIESIKDEIKKSCKKLINNGFRPFRVHWTGYNEDHLEVVVNSHFYIPPTGDDYWNNRQAVMMAINRAIKKNGVATAPAIRADGGPKAIGLSPAASQSQNGASN